jgi:riboflavin kinase/FMN adenylyltransferase
MNISQGLEGLASLPRGATLSIGNFDGVHRGHARLLEKCRAMSAGGPVAVATFEPHPLTALRPGMAPPRLTPPPVKQRLLEEMGVNELVVLAPTPQVLDLSAEDFWAIVRDRSRPAGLVEGPSFSFGKNRGGTIQRLREWTAAAGVWLHVIEPVEIPLLDLLVVPVSSSTIRWLLSQGRVRDAAICLGRPYALRGNVVKGFQRGRTIGMPTANLQCDGQMIPADGVYAARCAIDGRAWPVALSIGTMPTFGENQRQIEAHLIGFEGDLYDRVIEVEALDYLREQRVYADVSALGAQMRRDVEAAARDANRDPSRPIASLSPAAP